MINSDTMGATLCWTPYLLTPHSDAKAAVVKDLAEVLGNREPASNEIAKLT
jgi:hypothetical protein